MPTKRTISTAKPQKAKRGKSNGKGQQSPKPPKASQNRSGGDRKASKAKRAARASKSITASQRANQKAGERSYGLSAQELKTLLAEAKDDKKFPNPYRESSSYGCMVAALASLGLGTPHSFKAMKAKVAQLMGAERWAEFRDRTPRNKETANDVNARLHQNLMVIANRPKDYGKPLVQIGARIAIEKRENGERFYTLTMAK